jgi:hypothetical protein
MAKEGPFFSIDIKFDGPNCREWSFSVRTVVRAAGFDDEDEAMRKTWRKSDSKVMGALIFYVVPSRRMCRELWKYLQPSGALRYSLLQNLQNLQQHDMSIEEYYGTFTGVTSQLMPMTPKSRSRCESCVANENHETQPLMFQFVRRLRSLRTTGPSFLAVPHLLLWMRHLLF